jgi:hypothetical protein
LNRKYQRETKGFVSKRKKIATIATASPIRAVTAAEVRRSAGASVVCCVSMAAE